MLRALHTLEVISDKQTIGITELSRVVGLQKSTTARIINTLKTAGYVEQEARTGKISLTFKTFEVGSRAVIDLDLLKKARPLMEDFAEKTGESIMLAQWHKTDIIYIDCIKSTQPIQLRAGIGDKAPLYCTASGKSVLAALEPNSLESILEKIDLKAMTKNTITSYTELKNELNLTRARGYAIDNEERHEGVKALATVIKDYHQKVVGAITVPVFTFRISTSYLDSLASQVMEFGSKINLAMGYTE